MSRSSAGFFRIETTSRELVNTWSARLAIKLMTLASLAGILSGCGSTSTAQGSGSPTPSPTALSCTSSGRASTAWPAAQSRSTTTPPILSATLVGDTLTLVFDSGTPEFEVTPQSSAHFALQSGQGGSVDLAGSAGITIVLRGFRGDMRNYAGPVSITSPGPLALQVYETGDFEGVVAWGAGVSGSACANVTASGSTLTFRFIRTAAAT
jgi:hypothetical protein